MPWVEKYRPSKIDEIVGNKEAVERLGAMAATGNMHRASSRVLPDRQDHVHPPAWRTRSSRVQGRRPRAQRLRRPRHRRRPQQDQDVRPVTCGHPPPGRHKIILLDEAISTAAAQQAMRRTMELYSATTRFALACNASEKIIEPIQSRCAIVRFTRLSDQEVLERVIAPAGGGRPSSGRSGGRRRGGGVHGGRRPCEQASKQPPGDRQRLRIRQPGERLQGVRSAASNQVISDCVAHSLAGNVDDA